MKYPGRYILKGEAESRIVKAIQKQLNVLGCGTLLVDGDFGQKTENAVKLFQSRFADQDGNALRVDGKIGALTWAALFGMESVNTNSVSKSSLLGTAIDVAVSQIGILEDPLGSNRGPQVDNYLRNAGIDPAGGHYAWCAAFVYWTFQEAAKKLNRSNPLVKTPGVLAHWNQATCKKIASAEAIQNPALIKPGFIFVISSGGGNGHTGLVEKVEGGKLTTIEGNTNDGGSREGIGVFRRTRKVSEINKGYLDYGSK